MPAEPEDADAAGTVVLPMFPLGSPLLPAMPLALRVFEQRYLELLAQILQEEPSVFGVVLIERGQEVGGGDRRFEVGALAQVTELESGEGAIGLFAKGAQRFEVLRWLDDDPFPRAEVRMLPDLLWDPAHEELRLVAERVVRAALAITSEFVEQPWPSDIVLDEDPLAFCWQLAGITPVADLDRIGFLRAGSVEELLKAIVAETGEAAEPMRGAWPDV